MSTVIALAAVGGAQEAGVVTVVVGEGTSGQALVAVEDGLVRGGVAGGAVIGSERAL